jgi:hypothetical protein
VQSLKNAIMKTESELEQDILLITLKIQDEFPELSGNLSETPVKYLYTESNGISTKSLNDYSRSLHELFDRFSKTH